MRFSAFISFVLAFILSSSSLAQVQVAFFEKRTKAGQLVPIEPGGHLYHVAIKVGDHWLEAHPFYGVREVSDLNQLGELYSLVEINRPVPQEKYQTELGKLFSVTDPWENTKTTYCSKLVAQILDIKPTRMRTSLGQGLSPDGLYQILKSSPHKEMISCSKIL